MDDNRPGKWETISSDYLIRRPWLTARRDKVRLPDGRINDEFYVLEYPTWVNVIAITPDGRFVMVEQYRHGLKDVFTELCAGVAEPGEEPLEAAKRELAEETGYAGGQWSLNTVLCANPSANNNLTYCYIARGVMPIAERHPDPTEDLRVRILTRSELLDMLRRDDMKQALMAASLWRYFALDQS